MQQELYIVELLTFTFSLISLGFLGLVINRQNLLVAIMSLETVLLGINLNFIVFSYHFFEFGGKLIPLILLASTAAESAIGLSILVVLYRVKKNIKFISLTNFKD